MDFWTVAPILGLCAPPLWLWGLIMYLRIPNRSDWRARASLAGLCAPVLSINVWLVDLLAHSNQWHLSDPAMRHLMGMGGVWIPVVGVLTGLIGRPRLILAIVPASIGAMLFWFTTTLP